MSSSYAFEDQQRMAEAKNYFAWQSRMVVRELGSRVVEIGCGIGNFTGMLAGRAVLAVDIDTACLTRFRSRHAAADVEVLNRDWGAADWKETALPALSAFRADSCVCLNVLEHIEDDREALRRMAAILPPGGVIVLMLPAFPALYGPIDRRLGHYRRYTRQSVGELADGAGLRVKSQRYMNSVGLFGWWMNAHVFRREAQSAGQILVFDRLIVPWLSRVESMVPPPFGQSLLVVLRK